MCGIAGFLQFKPGSALKMGHLEDMTRTLKHRGPDDQGYYQKGPVGLGMTRLSIIDVQGGAQPISNERGTAWVVFNGEIYNHQELRKTLTAAGHRFATHSDTEVIVHAYEEYGDAFIGKLRGMFAFALWDETFQKLLLVRDHLGVKPLYYTTADGNQVVAEQAEPGTEIEQSREQPGRDAAEQDLRQRRADAEQGGGEQGVEDAGHSGTIVARTGSSVSARCSLSA